MQNKVGSARNALTGIGLMLLTIFRQIIKNWWESPGRSSHDLKSFFQEQTRKKNSIYSLKFFGLRRIKKTILHIDYTRIRRRKESPLSQLIHGKWIIDTCVCKEAGISQRRCFWCDAKDCHYSMEKIRSVTIRWWFPKMVIWGCPIRSSGLAKRFS